MAANIESLTGWYGHLKRGSKGLARSNGQENTCEHSGLTDTKGEDDLGNSDGQPEETLYFNIYHIFSCNSIVITDGSLI